MVRDEVFVGCDKGYVSLHERACDRLTARAFLATHRGRNAKVSHATEARVKRQDLGRRYTVSRNINEYIIEKR